MSRRVRADLRGLAQNRRPVEIDQLSFKDLFRTGGEKGLIDKVDAWFEYRRLRNITAHTYDEGKADDVFNAAGRFLKDARSLLRVLEKLND